MTALPMHCGPYSVFSEEERYRPSPNEELDVSDTDADVYDQLFADGGAVTIDMINLYEGSYSDTELHAYAVGLIGEGSAAKGLAEVAIHLRDLSSEGT